jgi:hypothetical protein
MQDPHIPDFFDDFKKNIDCWDLTSSLFGIHELFTTRSQAVFLVAAAGCIRMDHLNQSRCKGRMKVVLTERGSVRKPQLGHDIGGAPL